MNEYWGRLVRLSVVFALGHQALAFTCAPKTSPFVLVDAADAGRETTDPQVVKRTRLQMGTIVSIQAVVPRGMGELGVVAAIEKSFTEIERFEAMASEYRADSVISTLNENAGKHAVSVPDELLALLERCTELSRASDGAFDVTFLGMGKIWNFNRDAFTPPDSRVVAERRSLVDHRRLKLDRARGTAFLERAGMRVGLGGIGKGYAIDRAAAVLRAHGVVDFVAAASGDIYVAGSKGGAPWHVGVQHPRDPTRIVGRLKVRDRGVSTSGDYERGFVVGGKRYHHIIDPRTGYPAGFPNGDLASVTVVASDATTSDSLATAAFVLGSKRGLTFIAARAGVEALFIDVRGRITMTPRFAALIEFELPASASSLGE